MAELAADVVVVGSGVAGGMVAHQTAMAGMKVLLLEAGPNVKRTQYVENFRDGAAKDAFDQPYPSPDYAPSPQYSPDNHYLIVKGPDADAYKQMFVRAVGGTTWHWAASAWRFLPADLALKSTYDVGRDWALPYEEMEPYYYRAEVELGVSGPGAPWDLGSPRAQAYPMADLPLGLNDRTFMQVVNAQGFYCVPEPVARNSRAYDGRPPCCGNNNCMPICPIAAMYNGVTHVDKALASGADLRAEAVVYRIETDANNQIAAVHFKDPGGTSHRVTGKYFVIAANGIETPKLLLMSADDRNKAGVANSSDQVGRNMMDHPGYGVTFIANQDVWPGRGPMELTSIVNLRDGAFRSEYAGKKLHLNNQTQARNAAMKALKMGLSGQRLDDEIRRRSARTVNINSFHETLAMPENRLVLSDKKDKLGIPHPQITYDVGDYVRKSVEHTRQAFAQIAAAMGGTEVEYTPNLAPNNHICGGTLMGKDPKDSVVDADGRTYDHKNLFLATSAIMPTVGTVNCTLSIAALAIRTADAIKRDAGVALPTSPPTPY